MMRVGVVISLLVGCGSSEPAAPTPAPVVQAPVEPPAPDLCAPFVARARHVASADSGCSSDEQCTCRSGLLFADCGGAASMDTAHRLSMIAREAAAEGCEPDGPRCAPRECAVACVEGRCVER
ncbi:MAG: hypothetical protein H6724_13120 [Sandaracinus sp.]|nr:hypothetical protein [Sandaracinus sp.]